ncbi:Uncharacterised protein [uncultured archaeon]|nr:Uncharacterised protein [uncultured archaeon]
MTGVKSIIACLTVLFMLAQAMVAAAQNPSSKDDPVAYLKELQTRMQGVQKDLEQKTATFDKAGSSVTTETVTEGGVTYTVTVYKDKNGNVLREYKTSDEKLAITRIITASNGPVMTVTYNQDGTVAKTETFEPFGLKKYTEINNADGTKTEIVQDASQSANNTLTTKLDQNGNVISEELSTTPGLPPECTWCSNTGQYECEKPA